jgi:DNA-binding transcriptional LysR family regulator
LPRSLNLRQIEAFKAVIEHGSVSAAAEFLNISQPAMSKLISHLEIDTSLDLFDRVKGRLAPTEQGMRLYADISRIFSGVRQVENAVEAIRRENQGQLIIGVMPALSGSFIQSVMTTFLDRQSNVLCTVRTKSSQWIVDWLVTRQLDVGLISSRMDNPYIESESIMDHPLVCIMPLDHPLAKKPCIRPNDLDGLPFISFDQDSYTGQKIEALFSGCPVQRNVVLVTETSAALCGFVSAGLGVSLVHPLMVRGLQDQLNIRPFEPKIDLGFKLCYGREERSRKLVKEFIQETRNTAARISKEMLR